MFNFFWKSTDSDLNGFDKQQSHLKLSGFVCGFQDKNFQTDLVTLAFKKYATINVMPILFKNPSKVSETGVK